MSTYLHSEQLEITFPTRDTKQLATNDVKQGIDLWRVWVMMAYQDIKLRYRRSVLGPLWITLSMAITAYTMGFLYGHLFKIDMQSYFPYVVAGMLSWQLISIMITELIDTFTLSDNLIKQIKLPYTLYVQRVVMRNMITFAHNLLVIVPVLIIFHNVAKVNLNTLFLVPAILITYINGVTYGVILALIGSRYRDVSQVVKSFIQVIFFVTPIMWSPASLPDSKRIFVEINPFYSYVQLLRAPMIGTMPTMQEMLMVAGFTILGIVISYKMFARYRARIVYWL